MFGLHVHSAHMDGCHPQKRHWIPWNWSYEHHEHLRVLGIEPRSSAGATSALSLNARPDLNVGKHECVRDILKGLINTYCLMINIGTPNSLKPIKIVIFAYQMFHEPLKYHLCK